jgi:hypothetical protein
MYLRGYPRPLGLMMGVLGEFTIPNFSEISTQEYGHLHNCFLYCRRT